MFGSLTVRKKQEVSKGRGYHKLGRKSHLKKGKELEILANLEKVNKDNFSCKIKFKYFWWWIVNTLLFAKKMMSKKSFI